MPSAPGVCACCRWYPRTSRGRLPGIERDAAQEGGVDRGHRPAGVGGLLEGVRQPEEQRLRPRRPEERSGPRGPDRRACSPPAPPGSGSRPSPPAPQPYGPGSTTAAASAACRVASMPCSPATARSRARYVSYAACSASWSTASAAVTCACPNLSAVSACASFHAASSAIVRIGASGGQPGEVGVDVAGELVVQHRHLVGLRQLRHLHRDGAEVAQHLQRAAEDLGLAGLEVGGLRRYGQPHPGQRTGNERRRVRLTGEHLEERRRVGD